MLIKNIIILSCAGTLFGALLLALKPITRRVFSVRWQYVMWLAALAVMILPVRIDPTQRAHHESTVYTDAASETQDVQTAQTAELRTYADRLKQCAPLRSALL